MSTLEGDERNMTDEETEAIQQSVAVLTMDDNQEQSSDDDESGNKDESSGEDGSGGKVGSREERLSSGEDEDEKSDDDKENEGVNKQQDVIPHEQKKEREEIIAGIEVLPDKWAIRNKEMDQTMWDMQMVSLGCQLAATSKRPDKIDYMWLTIAKIASAEKCTLDEVMDKFKKIHGNDVNEKRGQQETINGEIVRGTYNVEFYWFLKEMERYRTPFYGESFTNNNTDLPKVFVFAKAETVQKKLKHFINYLATYEFDRKKAFANIKEDRKKYKFWAAFRDLEEKSQEKTVDAGVTNKGANEATKTKQGPGVLPSSAKGASSTSQEAGHDSTPGPTPANADATEQDDLSKIIGNFKEGVMMTPEEMTEVYWSPDGPIERLKRMVKKGRKKIDIQLECTEDDVPEDSLITDEDAGIQKFEVESDDGTRKATYFLMKGSDVFSKRFLSAMVQNYKSNAKVCNSREIKRPANTRVIRISTCNERSVFSYAGGDSKSLVFLEADKFTEVEKNIKKFMDRFWNSRRNDAMKKWIDEKAKKGIKKWCLRQDTTLLQAAFGNILTMLFGKHSDRGPELSHVSPSLKEEVWKFINHVSTMEVFTFSCVTEKTDDSIITSEKGACKLDIYTSKLQATIPMVCGLTHAQLANSQSITHHHPKVVDRSVEDPADRCLVSARNSPDLSIAAVRNAMLEQLERNYPGGLKAFANTIKAHTHRRGEDPPPVEEQFKQQPWYSKARSDYQNAKKGETKNDDCIEKTTTKWPAHKYNFKDRGQFETDPRPGPTNFMRVGQDVLEVTLHESARVTAQLEGRNIAHNFTYQKEESTVCLADKLSTVGEVCDEDKIRDIDTRYNIKCFKGNHPVSNKEHIGFAAGCRLLNYYKNDFCRIGKIQDEITHWKNKKGMTAIDITGVLNQYKERDLQECEDSTQRGGIVDMYKNYVDRIQKLLEHYDGKPTGVILLGQKDRNGNLNLFWSGGSGGSEEVGGTTSGAAFQMSEQRNRASVELSSPQRMGQGNNKILHELFSAGAVCELWSRDYTVYKDSENLRDLHKKQLTAGVTSSRIRRELGELNGMFCMGVFATENVVYGRHPEDYVRDIELSSWANSSSFRFYWRPAHGILQLEYQMQSLGIIDRKPKVVVKEDKNGIQEAITRDDKQNKNFDNDPRRLVSRWIKWEIEESRQDEEGEGNFEGLDTEGPTDNTDEVENNNDNGEDDPGSEDDMDATGDVQEEDSNQKEDVSEEDSEKVRMAEDRVRKLEQGVSCEDVLLDICNCAVASAARFERRHIVDGTADVLLGGVFARIGWVAANVPVMSSIRTYNATTLTFISSFHLKKDYNFQTIKVANGGGKKLLKEALFQAVVNRTSGVPAIFQRYAYYEGRKHLLEEKWETAKCYIPGPGLDDVEEFEEFLLGGKYNYGDIRSAQFNLDGFPPKMMSHDVRHYTKFLKDFRDLHLQKLVDMFYRQEKRGLEEAEEFTMLLRNCMDSAASHSTIAMGGWKTLNFCASQIMLDMREVFSDFYDPAHFVQFATGAKFGLTMIPFNKKQIADTNWKRNGKKLSWMNSVDHRKGRVFAERMKRYLHREANPAQWRLCGLKEVDNEACVALTGRQLHYGDFADHITCEAGKHFSRVSRSRLHNKPDPMSNFEHAIFNKECKNPDEMWPDPVRETFQSIVQFAETNEGMGCLRVPVEIAVSNEKEWETYSRQYDAIGETYYNRRVQQFATGATRSVRTIAARFGGGETDNKRKKSVAVDTPEPRPKQRQNTQSTPVHRMRMRPTKLDRSHNYGGGGDDDGSADDYNEDEGSSSTEDYMEEGK